MKYDVMFTITGSVTFRVEADNEDDAQDEAREMADDGFEVDDAEIDECWDVREVPA